MAGAKLHPAPHLRRSVSMSIRFTARVDGCPGMQPEDIAADPLARPDARSEERLRAIWEHAADAMALSDVNGTVLLANPAYCELYGYPAADIVGQNFSVVLPLELRAAAQAAYRERFAAAQPARVSEVWIQRADGSRRFVESR